MFIALHVHCVGVCWCVCVIFASIFILYAGVSEFSSSDRRTYVCACVSVFVLLSLSIVLYLVFAMTTFATRGNLCGRIAPLN